MNRVSLALLCGIFLQMSVLGAMWVSSAWPLAFGQEVKLVTVPVDPRSLFRGNYARLRYEISAISTDTFPGVDNLRHGEVVYVHLELKDDMAQAKRVTLQAPDEGLFIRGRVQYPNVEHDTQLIQYGIEAYFAPKEKALSLEKRLAQGAMAIVMVSRGGRAALKSIVDPAR